MLLVSRHWLGMADSETNILLVHLPRHHCTLAAEGREIVMFNWNLYGTLWLWEHWKLCVSRNSGSGPLRPERATS